MALAAYPFVLPRTERRYDGAYHGFTTEDNRDAADIIRGRPILAARVIVPDNWIRAAMSVNAFMTAAWLLAVKLPWEGNSGGGSSVARRIWCSTATAER